MIFNDSATLSASDAILDQGSSNLTLQGISIARAKSMKYLGVVFNENGKYDEHINKRCDATTKAFGALCGYGFTDKALSPKTKIQIYKTFVMPVLTYGLDTIVLNKKLAIKVRRTETNIVKNFLNVNVGCRNSSILRAVNINCIANRIMVAQLSLFVRLCENSYTKSIIDEFEKINCDSDFIHHIKSLTSSYTSNLSLVTKCKYEIEVVHSDNKLQIQSDELVPALTNILNSSNKDTIGKRLENILHYSIYEKERTTIINNVNINLNPK